MIAHKKEFYGGFAMIIVFAAIMVMVFMPVFAGKNGLEYMDQLYNSISKGSAYYIPDVKEKAAAFGGNSVSVTLEMASPDQAEQTAVILEKSGASVNVSGPELNVTGDLGKILNNCLDDADLMYHNKGQAIAEKYGYNEKQALFNWWTALKAMDKDLKEQSKFSEAKMAAQVIKKAVESSYNYYKIEPQKITDRLGVVILSLIFYVGYTLWYGFGVMFMFEGWGMKLEH